MISEMADYIPTSVNMHPFGQEEKVSHQQLFVAFCNHLHLGQWELAKACAKGLLQNHGEGTSVEAHILKVLCAIIEHPFDCSLGADNMPSAHHLAWLALQEHRNLTSDLAERLPASLSTVVEFRLLLYKASECTTTVTTQDVYSLFGDIQAINNARQLGDLQPPHPQPLSITEKVHSFLKMVLQLDAQLGNSILNHLKLPVALPQYLHHNQCLQKVYMDCLITDISALRQASGNTDKLVARVYKVLSLMDPSLEMEDLQLELLFLNLLDLSRSPYHLLDIRSIYSSLLGRASTYLIKEFRRIEGRERIYELNGELSISSPQIEVLSQEMRITLRLAEIEDRDMAWKEMFHQALFKETHILANVLDTCMTFTSDRMYAELVALMSPIEFAPLKPLVLLLGWNYVYSCKSANCLLEALYAPNMMDSMTEPLLQQACGKLTHQVQLVQWCLEKTRPFLVASGSEPGFEPQASEMFHELDSRSVLHMLHHATNLSQLDPAEVFDFLSKKPQLEVMSEEITKSFVKSVHFEEPQKLSIQQERDIAIFRSFLAIKSCMVALSNSINCRKSQGAEGPTSRKTGVAAAMFNQPSSNQRTSDRSAGSTGDTDELEQGSWEKGVMQHLKEARHQLSLLYPLTYRVETLENIFCLLFTRSDDIFVGKVAMSDSGGEEGNVDEDWLNKSATSLDSVASTPKNENINLDVSVGPPLNSTSDSKLSIASKPCQEESLSTVGLAIPISTEKRDRTSSGSIAARRSNTERSSESHSLYSSNGSGSMKNCFLANDSVVDALLSTLKECLADLTEARYSLAGPHASVGVLQKTGGRLMKYMQCSVSSSAMAQRISQLTQRVNEAWWRFQLVSQAPGHQGLPQESDRNSSPVVDSSSDEELYVNGSKESKDEEYKPSASHHRTRVSSQSGRSGSDASSSSSRRHKKRRRLQRSTCKASSKEHGVIARMLSSQYSLLRMCLHRGSHAQAMQVVKMFELEDKPEVSEVYFAEHWEQTFRRLQCLDSKVHVPKTDCARTPLTNPSSAASIATMAASGTASLSVSGIVDDLLASSSLPLLPTEPLVFSEKQEKHTALARMLKNLKRLSVAGVVVFDLACTACRSWKASKDLLEVAQGRLQLGQHSPGELEQFYKPRQSPQSATKVDPLQLLVGILPFVHQIASLITPAPADSTALIRRDILEEFYQHSVCDALLQAIKPLDAVGLRTQINAVLEQRKAIAGLSRALGSLSSVRVDSSGLQDASALMAESGLSPSVKGYSAVHQAMKHVLQIFDKNGSHCHSLDALLSPMGEDQHEEYGNYLMSLYNHVSVLSKLLVEARDWYPGIDPSIHTHSSRLKAVNPFCVLEESPNLLIGRLMFQNQISPLRLEDVAEQLKLNLVHVIVRSCCPTIPMHVTQDKVSRPAGCTIKRKRSRVILNDPGEASSWSGDVRHPEIVATDLLSRLILLMKGHIGDMNAKGWFGMHASILACSCQEFQDITEATKELAFVDLDLLQTPSQRLCFYVNVMNLLLAHASLQHIYQQLAVKEKNLPASGHTRHSSLTGSLHWEGVVTLPGTNSRHIIERVAYLNKMSYHIGQLGVVSTKPSALGINILTPFMHSAFDLRYTILRPSLHPPSCFHNILLHRLHALHTDDPWYKYLPPPETRLLFVISNGCRVSPALQVLYVDNVEEQLELAMQQFLENYVLVDEEKLRVTIPKQLDWFRKDFTGKSLSTDVEQGHIYEGLLNVVAPHMSKHMGERLENFVLSCSPGKIELEEKPTSPGLPVRPPLKRGRSFSFTVRIEAYDFTYGYRFEYGTKSKLSRPVLTHRRSSSQPENLLKEASTRNFHSPSHPVFSMTESTMAYLHSKSKLVASLAGLISMPSDERPHKFAQRKSIESSGSLGTSIESPKSLVFDESAFGEQREFIPAMTSSKVELTKMVQHVIGYSTMQRYVETYISSIVETAELLQSNPNTEAYPINNMGLTMRNAHACSLTNLHGDFFQAMTYFTLDHLVSYSKWTEALQLIQSLPRTDNTSDWLPDLPIILDFVLCCTAQMDLPDKGEGPVASESWKSLLCLHDKNLCSRMTLCLLPRLPVAVCVLLLEHCVANPASEASLKEAVSFKLEQMKSYKKIIMYAQVNSSPTTVESNQFDGAVCPNQLPVPMPYTEWQEVAVDSTDKPHQVMEVLLAAQDFPLAKEWADLHGVYPDLKELIYEKHLLYLLKDGSNTLMAYQILEAIPDRQLCLHICKCLVEADGERISLDSTVFLVQVITEHFLDMMSMEEIEELQALSLGAKALLCLREQEQFECEHLISKPLLILEQLLMNTKVEQASMVLKCLRQDLQSTLFPASKLSLSCCDALIARYAQKAIQIHVVIHAPQQDLDSTVRSVSRQSVVSPTVQKKSRANTSLSMASMSAISPPSTLSQTISEKRGIACSPPSGYDASSLSPRGQSPLISTQRRISMASIPATSADSSEPRSGPLIPPPTKEDDGLPTSPPKREDWVPDLKVTHCMVCKEERFSMFNRRHHCRRCGRVVCWRCSQLKAVVEGYGDAPVRICDQCYQTFIMPRPQHGNISSLEHRLKAKQPGSGRQSPRSSNSPSNRASPGIMQQHTPQAGTSLTSVHSGGSCTLLMVSSEWQLTLDDAYNSLIQQDFYYEQAPSTSVCLSILDLHSDHSTCGTILLQICRDLSEFLRPIRPGVPNPEVDYNLIISMMKTLLFNAKLRFITDGDISSIELCDSYRSFVDLLSLFVQSNSADIPSIQQLANADSARQVRDRLVLAERLALATEVSTKCGLDPSAVWSAWGLSCLRAGDYQGAREKFARILKAPSDKNVMGVASKLVTDIIQYLETSTSQADTAQAILNASAASIRDFIAEPTNMPMLPAHIANSPVLQECLYYITTYCPHISIIQFYHHHNKLAQAVSYILHQHCSSEVFLEGLLVPCMKQGSLQRLQAEMLLQDPSLKSWHSYLTSSCKYLNSHALPHVLYEIQLFMKDFVRASMTCIKFYQSGAQTYSDLFDRLHYLTKAREHMKAVLDEKQWQSIPRPPMTSTLSKDNAPSWVKASDANVRLMMSPSQLTNHMNTISQQIEVTKFLHRMAFVKTPLLGSSSLDTEASPQALPTLFGNSKVKAEVAYRVVLAGSSVSDGFQMAFQIVQDFRLPDTLIYSHIGRCLARQHKYKDIHQLLTSVRSTGLSSDQCCDEILDACVRVLANDSSQVKDVEGLIKLIKSDTNKINALMLCGRLKSAYLIAVKAERVEDVQRILGAAQRAGPAQAQMKTICESWLASQAEKREREIKTKELLMRSRHERR